jgi:hypothetical protein
MSSGPPDVVAITSAIEGDLISPPLGDADGACTICCDWLDQPLTCGKCQNAATLHGDGPTPVEPISLYVKPSAMRDRLTFYKDPRGAEDEHLAIEVAALMDRFFLEHSGELERRYGPMDASVVVPTRHREEGDHPLAAALDRLPAVSIPPRETVLSLGSGTIGRRTPDPDGFVADHAVRGRSLVLLDDVYTTGATAQSAAHALRAAGATVPAIVVIGRRLNPSAIEGVGRLVESQRARGFSFVRSPWA